MAESQKHIVIDARNRRTSSGRYTDRLVEHLQEFDTTNRYTILVQPDDLWQLKNPNFTTTSCRFKQFSFNPWDQVAFSWQLYRLKPDLVHFTMSQQPILYFGKIVTTTMDLTMLRYTRAGRLPQWLHTIRMIAYRFLLWQAHRKSKIILTISNFAKNDIATNYPFARDKISVTYCASDHIVKLDSIPLEGANKPFIFHVGNPFPHKNLTRLVEAFALVKKEIPDLQLIFSCKKEYFYEQLMKEIKDSPVLDSILFPGFVSDESMRWMFENAESYVLPTLSEGFGIPGLEAMENGCPLVSSHATCLPEVYGDAAVYFDPEDIEDMADKIVRVVSDKKLQKELVAKGRQQVKKYSWSKMAKETLAVYNEALNKN
jgi:glycosyltransferase involved in cell wall biosynthesis